MKLLISKILLLLTLLTVCLSVVFIIDYNQIGGQYQNSYNAALIDKIHRLITINEPKIILTGNSNLSFGIQSELIEKAMGMPVTNLGLHAGLGNAFHESVAKLGINEGDIIVVCHTSYEDDDKLGDPSLAWLTYDMNAEIWPVFRIKDYFDLAVAFPDYFRNALMLKITGTGNAVVDSSYCRTSFNEYGDIDYRPDYEQIDPSEYFKTCSVGLPKISDQCIERLNALNEYIVERDAYMVVAGYPIAFGEYSDFDEADVRQLNAALQSALKCRVISDFCDYLYPYSYFYNNESHLTAEGAAVRSLQLVEDLQEWEKTVK